MRSRTLEAVLAEFEKWRARRGGREAIPKRLWDAAVDLVDRYSSTAICRRLRLNQGRFKTACEERGVVSGGGGRRRAGGTRRRASGNGLRHRRARPGVGLVPAAKTFVELPPPFAANGAVVFPPAAAVMPRSGAGIRLRLESAAGDLTVSMARPDPVLADAVCQFVRGALGRGVGS